MKARLSGEQTGWKADARQASSKNAALSLVSGQSHEKLLPPESTGTGTGQHAVILVSSTFVVAVLNYALNIILGWTLPAAQYGQIGVSQTLIFICLWLISAGLPWVVTRSLAHAHDAAATSEDREEAWRTYKSARLANAFLTMLVVALLQVAFFGGWLPLEASYAPLIVLVGVTVSALGLGSIPNAGLQGLFRFRRISALRVGEAAVNIVVSVVLVLAGYGVSGALGGFAASAILASVLAVWSMSGNRSSQIEGWGGLEALRTAVPMTLVVFGGVLLTNIDLLSIKFLGGLNSDSLSGDYQVAAILARAPLFIGTALISAFYPRIAQDSGNRQAAREL
ncbi:MAG: oligosaccharide flippase family protein, partial [Chloroflexia bacterium]